MRTLKFRAWDTKKQTFPFVGFHIIGECTVFDLIKQYSIENFTDLIVEQFTGLQDSSGQDIYEGDIIKGRPWHDQNPYSPDGYWSAPVQYSAPSFHASCMIHLGESLNILTLKDKSIIGNIHQKN